MNDTQIIKKHNLNDVKKPFYQSVTFLFVGLLVLTFTSTTGIAIWYKLNFNPYSDDIDTTVELIDNELNGLADNDFYDFDLTDNTTIEEATDIDSILELIDEDFTNISPEKDFEDFGSL